MAAASRPAAGSAVAGQTWEGYPAVALGFLDPVPMGPLLLGNREYNRQYNMQYDRQYNRQFNRQLYEKHDFGKVTF